MRKLLVRAYPPAWRERYGDELLALLEELPVAPATILDLLLGAASAHWQEARGWAGEIRRASRRQVLFWLLGACVSAGVYLVVFVPEVVTSTVVPRQVHAVVVLLTALFVVLRILQAGPDPIVRSHRIRRTAMVSMTAWLSYMAVWYPWAPTGPGTMPTWVGRAMFSLAMVGCATFLVVELVRAARKVPAGRDG